MVDSWLEEEERLPSPPPDGGAFVAAPTSTKPPSRGCGPKRPKFIIKYKGKIVSKIERKSDKGVIPQKPVPPQLEKSKDRDDGSIRMNLEVAKRKLRERYREVENAKRQRRIQVLELCDFPKQRLARNQHIKPRNHNRNSANRRR